MCECVPICAVVFAFVCTFVCVGFVCVVVSVFVFGLFVVF